tara:strand:+ start:923 stop:1411 length:489 start_codon:yes stop_codon:yes gene_type:complete
MKFELKFKNINVVNKKYPICRIELNGDDVFTSKVQDKITFDADTQVNNVLRIHFVNKEGKDTVLDDNNQIKQDLNFELEKVIIGGIDLQHLIWESKYITKESVIDSCLFFGPKGYWELRFDSPILKWFLMTNHNKNNNDPTWEIDYNFYEKVCQKLNKIQTR